MNLLHINCSVFQKYIDPLTRIIVGDERCLKKNIFEKKFKGQTALRVLHATLCSGTQEKRERDFPYLKLWTNINCCKKQRW